MENNPDCISAVSMVLSWVMDDVGVNEECVLRRRNANLVLENIKTLKYNLLQVEFTSHIFGSQTEGTTTDGLHSDVDLLTIIDDVNVVQDFAEWLPGRLNLLMVRDEARFPGYCKLQLLRNDAPLPMIAFVPHDNKRCVNDTDGNVFIKHESREIHPNLRGQIRLGPAETRFDGRDDCDFLTAYSCKTLPKNFKLWPSMQRKREWPSSEMIEFMTTTGCLLVAVSHRYDERCETWRISTSLAERHFMFNLNITQIRCYILLKMIVKTYIEPNQPGVISSYICKTLLFRCIENTCRDLWKEHNLLRCVVYVLLYIKYSILNEMCPNYFNESSNLLLGKLSHRNKESILNIIKDLINSNGRFVIGIEFDKVGNRLVNYLSFMELLGMRDKGESTKLKQSKRVLESFFNSFCDNLQNYFLTVEPNQMYTASTLNNIMRKFSNIGRPQEEAARLLMPFIYCFSATVESSNCILQEIPSSRENLELFELSLNSDVTSSRLKFASYLYCTEQFERTVSVLEDVEHRITESVLMVCGCHYLTDDKYLSRFEFKKSSKQYLSTSMVAVCTMFSKNEINCCPRELQFEFFRSTNEELLTRDPNKYDWMDLAVMDALPYLYFLQYMTYRHLDERELKKTALRKLWDCAFENEHVRHKETVFNVLSKCMEYEGRLQEAVVCFSYSLAQRKRDNAVRWHIILLLWRICRSMTVCSNNTVFVS